MGFAPENQVRTGLTAGGRGIRTLGPSRETGRSLRRNGNSANAKRAVSKRRQSGGDRGFESVFLHRRVSHQTSSRIAVEWPVGLRHTRPCAGVLWEGSEPRWCDLRKGVAAGLAARSRRNPAGCGESERRKGACRLACRSNVVPATEAGRYHKIW